MKKKAMISHMFIKNKGSTLQGPAVEDKYDNIAFLIEEHSAVFLVSKAALFGKTLDACPKNYSQALDDRSNMTVYISVLKV